MAEVVVVFTSVAENSSGVQDLPRLAFLTKYALSQVFVLPPPAPIRDNKSCLDEVHTAFTFSCPASASPMLASSPARTFPSFRSSRRESLQSQLYREGAGSTAGEAMQHRRKRREQEQQNM